MIRVKNPCAQSYRGIPIQEIAAGLFLNSALSLIIYTHTYVRTYMCIYI